MALCMYQGLERACCTVASLCSGPETGQARWVRIKKQWEKLILFFMGALSVLSVGLSSRLSSKCRLKYKRITQNEFQRQNYIKRRKEEVSYPLASSVSPKNTISG